MCAPGAAALLDDMDGGGLAADGGGAMEHEGGGGGGCPSPLRAVHIGGEDLSMFDGSGGAHETDGSEFLLEEPSKPPAAR